MVAKNKNQAGKLPLDLLRERINASAMTSHLLWVTAAAFEGFTVPGSGQKTLNAGLMREGGCRKGPSRTHRINRASRHDRRCVGGV
jgi:hypothetical protein